MVNFSSRTLRPLSVLPLALAAALSVLPQAAQATPSGLSNYPSTDIYPNGGFHFDSDYFSGLNNGGRVTTGSSIGLEYGFGRNADGVGGRNEVGVDFLTFPTNTNAGQRFLLNGKTQLYNNDAAATRIVAGFYGVGSRRIAAGNWIYLLGSKAFGTAGRIHLGVAQSVASRSVIPDNRTVLQLGYDRALTSKLIFSADFQSGSTQFFAPGLIYNLNDKAGIQVSYLRGGSAVSPRNQIYFGFDYNFGRSAPVTQPEAPAAKGAEGAVESGQATPDAGPAGSGTGGTPAGGTSSGGTP